MKLFLAIFILGGFGAVLRWWADQALSANGAHAALSTFSVNMIGSFLIGAVYFFTVEKSSLPNEWSTAISVGFLGGLTTFSTFSLQIFQLISSQKWLWAVVYCTFSPLFGFLSAFLAISGLRLFFRSSGV